MKNFLLANKRTKRHLSLLTAIAMVTMLFTGFGSITASATTTVISDFQTGTSTAFQNNSSWSNVPIVLDDTPIADGTNKVAKYTSTAAGGRTLFGGGQATFDAINAMPNAVISARVFVPVGTTITQISFYHKVGNNLQAYIFSSAITPGTWQTIFAGPVKPGNNVTEIGFDLVGCSIDSTFYFDDISISSIPATTTIVENFQGSSSGFQNNVNWGSPPVITDPTNAANKVMAYTSLATGASSPVLYGGSAAAKTAIDNYAAPILSARVYVPSTTTCSSINFYAKGSGFQTIDRSTTIPKDTWTTIYSGVISKGGKVLVGGEIGFNVNGLTSPTDVVYFDDIAICDTSTIGSIPVSTVNNGTNISTLRVGDADATLNATVAPSNATNQTITWSVNVADAAYASIVANKLHAIAPGTAHVRATAGGVSSTEFTITILPIALPYTLWNFESDSVPLSLNGYGTKAIVSDPTASNKVLNFSWSGNDFVTAKNTTFYTTSINSNPLKTLVLMNQYTRLSAKVYIPSGQNITSVRLAYGYDNGGYIGASATVTLPTGYVGGWYTLTTNAIPLTYVSSNNTVPFDGNELTILVANAQGTGNIYFDDIKLVQGTAESVSTVDVPTKLNVSSVTIKQNSVDIIPTGFTNGIVNLNVVAKNSNTILGDAIPVVVLAALYQNNVLKTVNISEASGNLPNDGATCNYPVNVTVPTGTGYSIRLFVWESLTGLTPYYTQPQINQVN